MHRIRTKLIVQADSGVTGAMPTSTIAEAPKPAQAAPAPQAPRNQLFTPTTIIAIFAALGIAAYLITRYFLHLPFHQCRWILIAVLVVGGAPLVIDLARKAWQETLALTCWLEFPSS